MISAGQFSSRGNAMEISATKAALARAPVYSRAVGATKTDEVDAPSGIAFAHVDELQGAKGGRVFPDLVRRLVPFV